ncbi:MAG: DUF1883 domain-containing protein [Deltaproteobacteria bacterium]|nr:DUF1883 domain-containing protein [Deltaproteobacteria bacterium]
MKRVLLICIGLIFFATEVIAQENMRSVQMNPVIPALSWKGARLKNLPANAVISIEISTDNDLQLFLLNETNYGNFPLVEAPLFQGDVISRLSFTVQIPSTGNYYLLLDNRKNIEATNVSLKVAAGRGGSDLPGDIDDASSDSEVSGVNLSKINKELGKIFIFEPFPVTVNKCGSENAYSSEDRVILCQEYIVKVQKALNDKEKTSQVLLFVVFHEIGHVLLNQWHYPFYDNESIADEFATVLLVMVGEKKQLRATAEYFASKTTGTELLGKAFKDDRHPLSIQRARNIVKWVNDLERLERWQTVFIPHLQTRVLKRWQEEGKIDSLLPYIEQELDRREN